MLKERNFTTPLAMEAVGKRKNEFDNTRSSKFAKNDKGKGKGKGDKGNKGKGMSDKVGGAWQRRRRQRESRSASPSTTSRRVAARSRAFFEHVIGKCFGNHPMYSKKCPQYSA